jgi:hypothetical protein
MCSIGYPVETQKGMVNLFTVVIGKREIREENTHSPSTCFSGDDQNHIEKINTDINHRNFSFLVFYTNIHIWTEHSAQREFLVSNRDLAGSSGNSR